MELWRARYQYMWSNQWKQLLPYRVANRTKANSASGKVVKRKKGAGSGNVEPGDMYDFRPGRRHPGMAALKQTICAMVLLHYV